MQSDSTNMNAEQTPPRKRRKMEQYKLWTSEEEDVLKEYYGRESVRDVAARLSRSIHSVITRASMLRLGRKTSAWTPEEDDLLREWYGKEQIADTMNRLGRSENSVKSRARVLGLMRKAPRWSEAELQMMRDHYPTKGARYIATLTGRTREAIQMKAQLLGIESKRSRPWKQQEVEFLKRQWGFMSVTAIAKSLGRKTTVVAHRANRLQLPRKNRTWTAEEDAFIKKNYQTMKKKEMAVVLNRSRDAVSVRMMKLGVRRWKAHQWTNQERIILKLMYPKHTITAIAKRLKLRVKQVEGQIGLMGLKKHPVAPPSNE